MSAEVDLPVLEERCPDCGGTGRIGVQNGPMTWSTGSRCETCRETGMAPTEAGRRVLELVRRHARY